MFSLSGSSHRSPSARGVSQYAARAPPPIPTTAPGSGSADTANRSLPVDSGLAGRAPDRPALGTFTPAALQTSRACCAGPQGQGAQQRRHQGSPSIPWLNGCRSASSTAVRASRLCDSTIIDSRAAVITATPDRWGGSGGSRRGRRPVGGGRRLARDRAADRRLRRRPSGASGVAGGTWRRPPSRRWGTRLGTGDSTATGWADTGGSPRRWPGQAAGGGRFRAVFRFAVVVSGRLTVRLGSGRRGERVSATRPAGRDDLATTD